MRRAGGAEPPLIGRRDAARAADWLRAWLLEGALLEWQRPPDPHPRVFLVPWGRAGRLWTGYCVWVDVDSWQARSRGGRLAPQVLYTRWVPAQSVRPAVGVG